MVFLTLALLHRARGPHPYWKRQLTKRLTWNFYGRKRNCFKLSQDYLRRALKFATQHRQQKSKYMAELFETRIASACAEHGVQYSFFMDGLQKNDILLSRKVLADLAIFEPRTFQSLCELVKRQHATSIFSNNLNPSRRIFTKGML